MASTSVAPAAQAQTQTGLPDEIWEDIFLRLDAAADLARASAACPSFRRIVSARRFLRRFRSLHSPPVLAFISPLHSPPRPQIVPVKPPHRLAPQARALEQAADFTFSFLRNPSAWCFRHALHGRVLLSQHISTKTKFEGLLVCDPLHRRYVRIPPIPTKLRASTPRTATHLWPVLAPAAAAENDEEESFRVICTVHFQDKAVAFVFSSANQRWRGIISTVCLPDSGLQFIEAKPFYAHGCLYWFFLPNVYSLMLDTNEMKFSTIKLPPHAPLSRRVIVEAEEGRLRFIIIADGTSDPHCKNWQSNGVGAQEWQQDKPIPLPNYSGIHYVWEINGIAGRYLSLVSLNEVFYEPCCDGTSRVDQLCVGNYEHFILDIKTLLVEKLCTSNNNPIYGFPYAIFPPPLALPSI